MTFQIKTRINTELFIDKMATHFREPRVRAETNKGDQPIALAYWMIEVTLLRNAILITKGVEMRD